MNQQPDLHLWIIPLLPLVGAAVNGLHGRRFPNKLVSAIALAFPGAAFAYALWIASQFASLASPHIEHGIPWIVSGDFAVEFGFWLDPLSLVMLLVVTGVGFLIHIYSVGYMAHEGGYYRFFSYLNLFMFFMLMLILANNYLLMFVGWEGVGLASYLLIGFYFLKDSAANAGKKAFITNRIGDFGFLLGMFLLIKLTGSLQFQQVFDKLNGMSAETATWGILTATALLLFVGAAGKSAQLPLYVWLPDAMEGPTPVSALIHAATMVTAGVYMVARSNVLFTRAPHAAMVVAIVGAATAIFAATIGMSQFDIKRVLAYSTVSQLGYMFLACGVGAYAAGVFHLMTHAFFKALLFLSSGSVIHALSGEQDMRRMGGLRKLIPWTFGVMTVGTFAIAGTPFLSAFFSKDEILWKAFSSQSLAPVAGHELNVLLWLVGFITAGITSFYMFRLWFMTFTGERREAEAVQGHDAHAAASGHGDDHGHGAVHESPWVMLAPLVILAALSIGGGWMGAAKFEHFLEPAMYPLTEVAAEGTAANEEGSMETLLTFASVGIAAFGFLMAGLLYYKRRDLPEKITGKLGVLYRASFHKYWVDEIYGALIIRPIVWLSTFFLWKTVDVAIIDDSVNGMASGMRRASGQSRQMQSGNIRSYAGWVAAGAAAVVAFMIWMSQGGWAR